jgi:hypothetical protein
MIKLVLFTHCIVGIKDVVCELSMPIRFGSKEEEDGHGHSMEMMAFATQNQADQLAIQSGSGREGARERSGSILQNKC